MELPNTGFASSVSLLISGQKYDESCGRCDIDDRTSKKAPLKSLPKTNDY